MKQANNNIECGPEPLLLGEKGSQPMGTSEQPYKIGLGTSQPRGKENVYLAWIQLVQLWVTPGQKDSQKSPGQCPIAR